ncbi:MAG: hypothetical protein ABF290_14600 [Thiogranum sp.]
MTRYAKAWMEIVPVFTLLKLAIEYFFKLILTDSGVHGNAIAALLSASLRTGR